VFEDVQTACYQSDIKTPLVNYIYGLGGRDVLVKHIQRVYRDLVKIAGTGKVTETVSHLGIKE
jgi:pyruvate ferredoxin oxidoreductase alpha subunit